MGAGDYDRRLTLLRQDTSKEARFGSEKESFSACSDLWCQIEELSANELLDMGAKTSTANVRIRVRNWPDVSFKDRLWDKRFCELYVIDGINRDFDKNELVITAHRRKDVQGFTQ